MNSEVEQAAGFGIAEAKERGIAEVGLDELLLGCLFVVSRFGVAMVGGVVIDLEVLGVLWIQRPERNKSAKVAYSLAVVGLMDRAALIAKADGAETTGIEHLLAAFAGEEGGLMSELKRVYGLTSTTWRAAVAQIGGTRLREERVAGVKLAGAEIQTALKEYLTPEEAAEALGLHVQTLRGYVRTGKLPAFRLAGERAIRIRRSDLEAVLEPLVP